MTKLFSLPDKEKNYQAYMLSVIVLIWTSLIAPIVLLGLIFFPTLWERWLILFCSSIFIALISLNVSRISSIKTASQLFCILLWLLITVPCYSAGGITAPGIITQMSVILTAGFLLGWQGGIAIGTLTVAADFVLTYLEITGHLPAPIVVHTPLTRWIGAIIPFGSIIALQYYSTNHLRTSLASLKREMALREKTENKKNEILVLLQERVKELQTIYRVCQILQEDDKPLRDLFQNIVNVLPQGWQHSDFASARLTVNGLEYISENMSTSDVCQAGSTITATGAEIKIEIFYSSESPANQEQPFLVEERHLIDSLLNFLKIEIERRDKVQELKDYKYALDVATLVSISDADWNFIYVNENLCKKSMYSSAELIGKHHSILHSDFHPAELFDDINSVLQTGSPFNGEFCHKDRNGNPYWVYSSIIPFMDGNGNITQVLTINQDISERKDAEAQSRKSDQTLRKITSQIPGNSYMFELEESGKTRILFMNRGTDTFNHKYENKEIVDNPGLLREVLHEDDKVKFNDAMRMAYRTKSKISFQYRIVVNGTVRWRWMQAVPEEDHSGNLAWYGSTSDITPLVEYIATIEQILFDISHVMRRPISTIIGLTNMINDPKADIEQVKIYSELLKTVCTEMEVFTSELNDDYNRKRQNPLFNIDMSSQLDRRDSLFR
jgi:PAS domain S-box-containing protein